MSEEGDKKLYSHYKSLIAGSYKSVDVVSGKGNRVRDQLVIDDAKKHLADLIKKRPNIQFEEPKEPEPKKTNSKRKK